MTNWALSRRREQSEASDQWACSVPQCKSLKDLKTTYALCVWLHRGRQESHYSSFTLWIGLELYANSCPICIAQVMMREFGTWWNMAHATWKRKCRLKLSAGNCDKRSKRERCCLSPCCLAFFWLHFCAVLPSTTFSLNCKWQHVSTQNSRSQALLILILDCIMSEHRLGLNILN